MLMHLILTLLNQVFVYCDSTPSNNFEHDSNCKNRRVKITRVVDENSECRKCLPVFQQIEFIIRRSSCEDTQIVKENFNDLTKAINAILSKSNDKFGIDLIDYKTQFVRFATQNIRTLLKEFATEVEKSIVQGIADYNDASSSALALAQSNYSVAINSLATQPATVIVSALQSQTSAFNTSVSSIISGVAVSHVASLKLLATNTLANIQDQIERVKRELVEIMKQDIEDRVQRLMCWIKNNNEEEIKEVEAAILLARDTLIADLEKHDLKLFEVVKYLLEMCKDELTGEKRNDCNTPPFPLLLQSLGMNLNENEFSLLYPGVGMSGLLN